MLGGLCFSVSPAGFKTNEKKRNGRFLSFIFFRKEMLTLGREKVAPMPNGKRYQRGLSDHPIFFLFLHSKIGMSSSS